MFKNHPKTYTKPPNGGYGYKHSDLALHVTEILAERPGKATSKQPSGVPPP